MMIFCQFNSNFRIFLSLAHSSVIAFRYSMRTKCFHKFHWNFEFSHIREFRELNSINSKFFMIWKYSVERPTTKRQHRKLNQWITIVAVIGFRWQFHLIIIFDDGSLHFAHTRTFSGNFWHSIHLEKIHILHRLQNRRWWHLATYFFQHCNGLLHIVHSWHERTCYGTFVIRWALLDKFLNSN